MKTLISCFVDTSLLECRVSGGNDGVGSVEDCGTVCVTTRVARHTVFLGWAHQAPDNQARGLLDMKTLYFD
jgi:hypothetical protein